MPKFTKKWLKDFEKRYENAFKLIKSLEEEYAEMKSSNPDNYQLDTYITIATLEFDDSRGLTIYHKEKDDETDEYVEIGVDGSSLGGFSFKIKELKQLIEFRNSLINAIDEFERPIKEEKVEYDLDDCDDEEDSEVQEWTIKAEQPLTQSWTYTVTAKSACEAIKMIEEDNYQDGVVNNDDNEYYDYGEIEYEAI
jgi:hypothetical protein